MGIKQYYLDMRTLVGNAISDFKESLNLNEHITNVNKDQDSVYFKESAADGTGMIYQDDERLFHTTGTQNIFFGQDSGNLTTSGSGMNVAFGNETLTHLSTGRWNVVSGFRAMEGWGDGTTITGGDNVAIGLQAFRNVTSGSRNVAVGDNALYGGDENEANDNVAIGSNSLWGITTGSENTALGVKSGIFITTGTQNVIAGYEAGRSIATGTGNVLLGYKAGRGWNGSNRLIIENSDNISTPLIDGDFDANTLTFNVTNLNLTGLPTSAAGLSAGDVWSNSGVLTIV